MCGIVGAVGPDAHSHTRALLPRITHRGPDATGIWADENGTASLGHARLAVVGLGATGAQPMASASGRYVLSYNGEAYEHADLRRRLEAEGRAPEWRGGSDTETLLACIEAWGLGTTLERTVGMFAIALWDRERRRLTLVRDRLGEKPLHWATAGRTVVFASEPAALASTPGVDTALDPDAVAALLRLGQVPAPRTVHAGIRRLPPGTLLHVDADGRIDGPRSWWSAEEAALRGLADPLDLGPDEAVDALGTALGRAVAGQTLAEVPLGAFLSGGTDSTAVTALLVAATGGGVRTFTVGFAEAAFDESPHAAAVARHLGTEHTTFRVTEADVLDLVPDLPAIAGEPFADASFLPTLLLSRLTRRHVTVALTGDGGDELLGGYSRYSRAMRIGSVPVAPGMALARLIRVVPVRAWDVLLRAARRGTADPGRASDAVTGHRLHSLARLLGERDPALRYRDLASVAVETDDLVLGRSADATAREADEVRRRWAALDALDPIGRMMLLDQSTYLPDDILTKVDRAAMSVALETRIPLLDHRVVELAWRMPPALRTRGGVAKWPLRMLAARHVPSVLLDRPKAGFAVPLAAWLRGQLRPWAEDLLGGDALQRGGLLDPSGVRRLWDEHLTGRRERHNELWPVLMLQAWLARRPTVALGTGGAPDTP